MVRSQSELAMCTKSNVELAVGHETFLDPLSTKDFDQRFDDHGDA